MKQHAIIIVPGLGDEVRGLTFITHHWRKYGLNPLVYSVGWRDGEMTFRPKLTRLVRLIDSLKSKGQVVSLVGTSAGGSAVLNTFVERSQAIHRVISVCARLRVGKQKGFRSFQARTASSPAFAQSVKLFESVEGQLTKKNRERIMTIRALLGDELVPAETAMLRGAYNVTIPTLEHMFSIVMALTFFSKPLIRFLTSE